MKLKLGSDHWWYDVALWTLVVRDIKPSSDQAEMVRKNMV